MSDSENQIALAREDLCRYLAACYYQPEREFEKEGVFVTIVNAATLIHPALIPLATALEKEFNACSGDSLLLDYTRLFIGPNHTLAQPYGSVWLGGEKTLMGPSTQDVLGLYREGGFDMDDSFRELPDHIAVELEFLYLLIFRQNEARREGEMEHLETITALKKQFLGEHLQRWIGPFTAAIQAGAQQPFYRHLAELTALFVAMESRIE